MRGVRKEVKRFQGVRSVDLPCDPDAERGVCHSPWCNNWIENMKRDKRCHDPECDGRLWQEAMTRGLAFYTSNGILIGTVVPLMLDEKIIPIPQKTLERTAEGKVRPSDICVVCEEAISRPSENKCNRCHRKQMMAEYEEFKAKGGYRNHRRADGLKGRYRDRKINKIRGLGGIVVAEDE